jgi:hypothetical protein
MESGLDTIWLAIRGKAAGQPQTEVIPLESDEQARPFRLSDTLNKYRPLLAYCADFY